MELSVRAMILAAVLGFASAASAQDDNKRGREYLHMLNQGYSLLYSAVSGISNADKAFAVKFENDATQRVVTETSEYLESLTRRLEQLATDYPSLRLNLSPLPKVEKAKQNAANLARIKSFTPVTGRTGADFERTLLFTVSGGLNQTRHLARVMAQAERSEQRRRFLKNAEQQMDNHYNAILELLSEQYYVHDTYTDPE